ncbi:MAG: N-acetylmuramoyl-L-alanine amidase [Alphaproteobacteria bacterium]
MLKKISKFFILILIYFTFVLPAKASNNAIVFRTGIQSGNVSRFVLETSQMPVYNIFYLSNPTRIVIDIDNLNISKVKRESSKSGFISNVRLSAFDKNTSRIVLDLANFAKVKNHFVLNPINSNKNYRFVVDIENATSSEFNDLVKNHYSYPSQKYISKSDGVVEVEVKSSNSKTSKKVEITESVKKGGTTTTKTTTTTTKTTSTSKTSFNTGKMNKPKIIVIDAGHGGKDPGAIGYGGTQEKNIVLSMAKQLRDILKKNPQYKIIMTRETDVFLPLRERSEIAEKNNATFFISIHADSSPKKTTKGFSIYTLSERATDEESKKIAEKENASDLLGIGTFDSYDAVTKNILGDLMQTQVKIASVEMSTEIVNQVRQDVPCVDSPNREAPFTVLRSAVPSVLVEMGFLSNKDEEKKLNQKWYREKLAYSLARGIDKILKD